MTDLLYILEEAAKLFAFFTLGYILGKHGHPPEPPK